MYEILELLSVVVLNIIRSGNYIGIFILMTLESAAIPIPSEIIMPFSGFLVSRGELAFGGVIFLGALGNLVGSIVLYCIGFLGGRRLALRYGKVVFFSLREMEKMEFYFKKYGSHIAFWTRMLPIVRTYISFPAGLAGAGFKKFAFYTFFGSFIWSIILTFIGFILGENWSIIEIYFRKFDIVIVVLLVLGLTYFIWHKIADRRG